MTTAATQSHLAPLEVRPCGRYEWERLVRRIVMPQNLKLLALVLATYADPDGTRVRPGTPVLAAVTDSGERTVRRLLTILREDLGLIEMVARGGGRGRSKRTAVYRLTVPTDLLDRVSLLSPDDRADDSPAIKVAAQSDESPATQEAGQSKESAVDNSETPAAQVAGQSDPQRVDSPQTPATQAADENEFHRPNDGVSERLTGQIDQLTGHSAGRTTTHIHQPPRPADYPEPAQPQTAHDEPEASQTDHGESSEPRAAPPAERCDHGLVRRKRADGSAACALCRRQATKDRP